MAQIPITPGRSRMPGVPNAPRIGGTVTADDMGSTQFRQWQRLGEVAGHASNTLQQFQIQGYHEREETDSSNAFLAYQEKVDKRRDELFQIQGSGIYDISDELDKFSKQAAEEALSGLKNPLGKDLFNKSRQFYDYKNRIGAAQHTLQQHQVNMDVSNNAKKQRAVVDAFNNPGSLPEQIKETQRINQEMYAKYGPEKLELENINSTSLLVEKAAESLATNPAGGPNEALKMLNDPDIANSLPQRIIDGLKTKYGKAALDARESAVAKGNALSAMDDEVTGMTENEARRKYYNDPNLTEKQAEAKLDVFRSSRSASNADTITKADERKNALQNAYIDSGYNIAAMPDELQPTRREQAELVEWGNAFRSNGGKNPNPNINLLFKLDAMSQSKLQEYLLNPDNSDEFYNGVGGAGSTYAKEYIDKARGKQSDRRPLTDTNVGWAAAKLAEDEGLILGSERDENLIKDFSDRFAVLAKDKARTLDLKNENDLSSDDRNAIYQKMRVKGTYVGRPILNAMSLGLLGNEERTHYDMLADEEAIFENFTPTSDDDFWDSGDFAPPEAVRNTIGHKAVETSPIYDAAGNVRYVKVIDKSATGKRTVYLDADGNTVSEEEALAE